MLEGYELDCSGLVSDITLNSYDSLVIVDLQNDFLSGGSLVVPLGDEIVPVVNCYIECFCQQSLSIFATQDWHPADHCSFKPHGGLWPVHCVADTPGADFPSDLKLTPSVKSIHKACVQDQEAYSGFDRTALHQQLKRLSITRLFICGLATDYCVLETVREALVLGYKVFLLVDAIRAVNIHPADGEKAIATMQKLGAQTLLVSNISR